MRIRRKKHLFERMEKLTDVLIVAERDIQNVQEAVKDKKYFDFPVLFGNSNAVRLEIGCGKGGFAVDSALKNPENNFLAVELLENIIVMAAENAVNKKAKNVLFFNCGADYLARYVKNSSIEKIYLNFSPPYPGDRYENRRLTKSSLVSDYKNFLIDGGEVLLKTDDKDFFEYSLTQFSKFGFAVKDVSGEKEKDCVRSEYETKFINAGLPVYSLSATKVN